MIKMPYKNRVSRKKKKYKAYKKGGSTRVIIKVDKKYGKYLAKRLAKEHPKTKGKIKLKNGKC